MTAACRPGCRTPDQDDLAANAPGNNPRGLAVTQRQAPAGTRAVSFAVVIAGAGLLVMGLSGHAPRWSPPPAPAAALANPASPLTSRQRGPAPLPRSVPVTIAIPAIRVDARIIPLGLDAAGQVAVPSLTTPFLTSWYDPGPAPGQTGNAVLLGHVDAAGVGPAVFYRLGELQPGNLLYVARRDRRTAVFRVTSVGLYPQAAFPATRVYSRHGAPAVVLVTCGGQFDWQTHLYLDRVVVFAAYTGSR